MLASVWQPYGTIAVLTSLKEVAFWIRSFSRGTGHSPFVYFPVQVTVYDAALKVICHLQCELEPVFLACGPKAIALGLNNHAWLYSALDGQLQRKLQYIGSVETVRMNETHIAALVDGKVHLQLVSFIWLHSKPITLNKFYIDY